MRTVVAAVLLAAVLSACGATDSDEVIGSEEAAAPDEAARPSGSGSADSPTSSITGSIDVSTTGVGQSSSTTAVAPVDGSTSTSEPAATEETTTPAVVDGDVICRIVSGIDRYEGACEFELAGSNGSFAVQLVDESPILGEVTVITVSIDAEGHAEVRGLTVDGINSRWGPAERSEAEPACWTGSDFEVCAF